MIVEPIDPADPRLAALIQAAQDEMRVRYAGTSARPTPASSDIAYVLATHDGEPVGAGGLQPDGEIRRMYVAPNWRRRGVARVLLAALEERAAASGRSAVRLHTGTLQTEALALYESAGYRRVPLYGPHVGDPWSVCFEK